MVRTHRWRVAALAALIALGSLAAIAQEPGQPGEMSAEMQEMMKYAMPNEHHAQLKELVGKWKTQTKMWMQPGAPPAEGSGTCENTMMLGGRFMRSEYTGEFMGMPFTGVGLEGFDAYRKKHIGVWMDNMGTMMMTFEGGCEQGGKVQTTASDFVNPGTGEKMRMKTVRTVTGPDSYTLEGWYGPAGGEMVKSMEIRHTRM